MKRLAIVVALCAACGHPAVRAPAATCQGPLTINGQEALAAMGACPGVEGDVTIKTAAALDLTAIAGVEEITGELVIGPTFDLDGISLEGLRRVGALRLLSNGLATGVYVPRLEHAGTIEIAANVALAQLTIPALRTVEHDLIIEQNPSLEVVDLGALTTVGGVLGLRDDGLLKIVDIQSLSHAASIDLTGTPLPEDHPLRTTSQP